MQIRVDGEIGSIGRQRLFWNHYRDTAFNIKKVPNVFSSKKTVFGDAPPLEPFLAATSDYWYAILQSPFPVKMVLVLSAPKAVWSWMCWPPQAVSKPLPIWNAVHGETLVFIVRKFLMFLLKATLNWGRRTLFGVTVRDSIRVESEVGFGGL